MFWGVRLQAGRKYSQEVSTSYQVTKAVLETPVDGSKQNNKRVHVMLSSGGEEFVLATLDHNNVERNMDMLFSGGEKVTLFLKGEGTVHLTGYLVQFDEEEDDESDDENPFVSAEQYEKAFGMANGKKRGAAGDDAASKRAKIMNEPEDDEDNDEEDEDFLGALDEEYDSMDDEDGDFDEMDDEEDEDDEVPVPVKVNGSQKAQQQKKGQQAAQVQKQQQQQPQQKKGQQTAQAQKGQQQQQQQKKGQPTPQSQKGQQQKANPQLQKAQQAQGKKGVFTPPAKFVSNKSTPDGMDIYDISSGVGPVAKKGKMVHVKYIGRLPNNKEFDRSTNKPFSFRLGDGEVIQGWEKGIEGMRVGGKRRLFIPPKLAYGNQRTGPIPANAHLDFEVELVRVS